MADIQTIDKAIKIAQAEAKMRWRVFWNQPELQKEKYDEMKLVRQVLEEYKAEKQPTLFPMAMIEEEHPEEFTQDPNLFPG